MSWESDEVDESDAEARCKVSEPYEDDDGVTWIHIIVVSTKPAGALVRWTGQRGIIGECSEGGDIKLKAADIFEDPELRITVVRAIEE